MFNPLGAFSSFGQGTVKGFEDPGMMDMIGRMALGRAFQGDQQQPMAPPPGQASMPMQRPPQMAQPQAPPQPQSTPMQPGAPGSFQDRFNAADEAVASGQFDPQGANYKAPQAPLMPPQQVAQGGGMGVAEQGGGGMPPQGAPQGPPQMIQTPQGLMPQLDLGTLVQRIQQRNPNIPPAAMWAAVRNGAEFLNAQGKQELAQAAQLLRTEELKLHRDRLNFDMGGGVGGVNAAGGQGAGGPEGEAGGLSRAAIVDAGERYYKTGVMPQVGYKNNAARAAIMNYAAEKRQNENVDPSQVPKNQQEFKASQVAIQRFRSGKQGDVIRALDVTTDHLATLNDLIPELDNGQIQGFNRLAQMWAQQTGVAAPVTFDATRRIVGTEVLKALGVANAGTEKERAAAADAFHRANSPEQLKGAIAGVQKLLSGQIEGLRRQFVASTGLPAAKFDSVLSPAALKFLTRPSTAGGGTPTAPAGGGWGPVERIE